MESKIDFSRPFHGIESCPVQSILAIKDTLNILHGKWKLPILAALLFEKKRYTEIKESIPDISPRMLSKELKDLEMNGIITRHVHQTSPVLIEYNLTASGRSISSLLEYLIEWGQNHRKNTLDA